MPSELSVRVMSSTLWPEEAISKMRRTTSSTGGLSTSVGRSLPPSWTLTRLYP
ncbi:MAG: hypothetical protein OXS30_07690 [Chloroflexota bacterium]|nr:hypothetical protein [Chloroflexota bacterium]